MNSQNKKLIAIGAVVMLHAVAITLMLAQHGCKSDGQKASPPEAAPAPAAVPAPVAVDNTFVAPMRPAPETPATPILVNQFAEPLATEPVSTPIAPSAPSVTWQVVAGDSLEKIARKNGITAKELAAANAPKVTMTTPLRIGQVLVIPAPAASSPKAASAPATDGSIYTAVAGDSLEKIAKKNGTTAAALRSTNKLTSDVVRIGQKLTLPSAGAATGPSPAGTFAAPTAPTTASDEEYTIVAGDNLGKIAIKTGTTSKELMSLNGLNETTAKALRPGKKLKLPAGGHAPSALPPTSMAPAFTPSSTPTLVFPAPGTLPPPVTPVTGVPDSSSGTPITPVQ